MPRISMRELGQRLGVDRSTISRALSPEKAHLVALETRERIIAVAKQAGYTLDLTAQGLRRGRSQTIGVLAPDLTNETFIKVIRQILASIGMDTITPLIAESLDKPEETRRILQTFRLRRVDAIVSLNATELDVDLLKEVAKDVPVILAVRSIEGAAFPSALCDDDLGGALVAEHLAARGHKIVCQIRGPQTAATFRNRAIGFSRVCRKARMTEMPRQLEARLPHSAFAKAALDLILSSPVRPTAIFAHNDALAIGVIESMKERGLKCPDDLAVIGFNNIDLGGVLATPLTTVAYPIGEVGSHAGHLVRTLIGDPAAACRSMTFKPRLVVRKSG